MRRPGFGHVLPAHPLITAPVAAGATGRSKPAIYQAFEQLQAGRFESGRAHAQRPLPAIG
jgi:hypothetical protein